MKKVGGWTEGSQGVKGKGGKSWLARADDEDEEESDEDTQVKRNLW